MTDREINLGVQRILNAWGVKDNAGRAVTVDGVWGPKTEQAKQKAKLLLKVIMR